METVYWTKQKQKKFLNGKSFLLTPWQGQELLSLIGLLNKDGSMSADQTKKFIQVNHMLRLLVPVLKELKASFSPLRIVDMGCGNSYLSFILAWYLKEVLHHPFELLGIDHLDSVIKRCMQRAQALDWKEMSFQTSKVAESKLSPDPEKRPHLLIALHACDTASDDALFEGLSSKADAIAVAPCCQAELAAFWSETKTSSPFSPIFSTPHLRRCVAADMTDMMRILLLRSRGYEVQATEFVPSEHTPKNRLILCRRRGNFLKSAREEFLQLKKMLAEPCLHLEKRLEAAEVALNAGSNL